MPLDLKWTDNNNEGYSEYPVNEFRRDYLNTSYKIKNMRPGTLLEPYAPLTTYFSAELDETLFNPLIKEFFVLSAKPWARFIFFIIGGTRRYTGNAERYELQWNLGKYDTDNQTVEWLSETPISTSTPKPASALDIFIEIDHTSDEVEFYETYMNNDIIISLEGSICTTNVTMDKYQFIDQGTIHYNLGKVSIIPLNELPDPYPLRIPALYKNLSPAGFDRPIGSHRTLAGLQAKDPVKTNQRFIGWTNFITPEPSDFEGLARQEFWDIYVNVDEVSITTTIWGLIWDSTSKSYKWTNITDEDYELFLQDDFQIRTPHIQDQDITVSYMFQPVLLDEQYKDIQVDTFSKPVYEMNMESTPVSFDLNEIDVMYDRLVNEHNYDAEISNKIVQFKIPKQVSANRLYPTLISDMLYASEEWFKLKIELLFNIDPNIYSHIRVYRSTQGKVSEGRSFHHIVDLPNMGTGTIVYDENAIEDNWWSKDATVQQVIASYNMWGVTQLDRVRVKKMIVNDDYYIVASLNDIYLTQPYRNGNLVARSFDLDANRAMINLEFYILNIMVKDDNLYILTQGALYIIPNLENNIYRRNDGTLTYHSFRTGATEVIRSSFSSKGQLSPDGVLDDRGYLYTLQGERVDSFGYQDRFAGRQNIRSVSNNEITMFSSCDRHDVYKNDYKYLLNDINAKGYATYNRGEGIFGMSVDPTIFELVNCRGQIYNISMTKIEEGELP